MSEPIIQGGCFLVSRQLMNSGIMNKPPEYLKVWIHLLSNAYFKDKEGLKRGQGFTSLEKLREVLSYKVGYRTETPTKKKVYGIIEWLRNPNEGTAKGPMIVTTKVTHGFVYTVVNYDLYQDISNYEGNNEGTTKELRRESKGNNIKKNVKECKNEIKDIVEYLNKKTSKKYQTTSRKTISLINARMNDGFTVDDFKNVIDIKSKEWLNDKQWDKYLRPETLFGTKFEGYLNECPKEITNIQNGITPITTPLPKREEEFC